MSHLVDLVNGVLLCGSPDGIIDGFSCLAHAGPGDLSFFCDARYESRLMATRAGAVLVPGDRRSFPDASACIGVADPSGAFEAAMEAWTGPEEGACRGIHPSAVVAASAVVDAAQVAIGPNAVVGEGAVLGAGVEIGAGSFVGAGVSIGDGSRLFPNVTVLSRCLLGRRVTIHSGAVIGADGFGYVFEGGRHRKIRQSGIVQIDDDVEIGAGTTVDRARFGRTRIGAGTKIDNLVQIGHNVTIGRHCILVAGVAIAGSAVVGDGVVIAAQSGIAGHFTVGSGSTLGARCGVTRDLPPGGTYLGFPATPAAEERRRIAGSRRLPALTKRIAELEARLRAVEGSGKQAAPANDP